MHSLDRPGFLPRLRFISQYLPLLFLVLPGAGAERKQIPLPAGTVIGKGYDSSELSTPPSPDEAIWVDSRNPGWFAVYGSQAGRRMFPPRPAPEQFKPDGPSVTLGYSRTVNLGSGEVSGIAGAPDGRLYVGLSQGGVRICAPGPTGGCNWTTISAGTQLASNKVTTLAAFGDEIWIGTLDAGISVVNTKTDSWRTLNKSNSALPSNYISRIRVFQTGSTFRPYLWVSTDTGAAGYYWSGSLLSGQYNWTYILTPANSPIYPQVNDITVQESADGDYIWFATHSSMLRWNRNLNLWQSISLLNVNSPCGVFDGARSAVTDRQGRIWLAIHRNTPASLEAPLGRVDMGICRYDGSSWTSYRAAPYSPNLPGDTVTDISVDAAGRVWLSMQSGGAAFDPKGCSGEGSWTMYTASGLFNANVTRVQAVGDMVWFGHYASAGLSGYALNWKQYTASQIGSLTGTVGPIYMGTSGLFVGVGAGYGYYAGGNWSTWLPTGNNVAVSAITVQGQANFPLSYYEWIGTAGNGLYYWHQGSFTRISTADGLPGNTIRALAFDSAGRLWVGTSQGLALRAGSYWLAFHSTDSPLSSNQINTLAIDGSGRVWIGTEGGGITIYDETISGPGKWTKLQVTEGLPSNRVNGLATAPDGSMWAATDAGIGLWRPSTGAWTKYAGTSLLPSDEVLSVAVDPHGRLWAGTSAGLVLRDGGVWQRFHYNGSGLAGQRVTSLGADTERVWAANLGEVIAVRGLLPGPTGLCSPILSDFSPKQGPLGTLITITGKNFDDRSPSYNKVLFGIDNPFTTVVAGEIQSASTTSIVVKAPALGDTGRLAVQANGLTSVKSTQDFTVIPGFGTIQPTCVSGGDTLTIQVSGLPGPSQVVYVKVGNGAWRQADYRDRTLIQHVVRVNDTSGAISLRIGYSGPIYTSATSINVAMPTIVDYRIQQEVEPYRRVFGKRTLVQVRLTSDNPSCAACVNGGTMDWKLKNASVSTRPAALAPYFTSPAGLKVYSILPDYSLSKVANFVGIYGLIPPGEISVESPRFPISQFDGVHLELSNNGVTMATVNLPASAFDYHVFPERHFINFAFWPNLTQAETDNYMQTGLAGMLSAARIYMQPDGRMAVRPGFGGGGWIYWPPADGMFWNNMVTLDGDNCAHVVEHANDIFDTWNDPHHENGTLYNGAAIIAGPLATPATHMGCSYPGKWAFAAVNFDNNTIGKTMLHEAIHTNGLVAESSPDYDHGNPAKGHSRYDGGLIHPGGGTPACNQNLTFAAALRDAYGSAKTVIGLYGGQPVDYSVGGCGTDSAKDIMSYADSRLNGNSFINPWTYDFHWGWAEAQKIAEAASTPAVVGRILNLSGSIDKLGTVVPSLSYLSISGNTTSIPDPAGTYRLQFRAAGNQLLSEFPFDVPWETSDGDPVTVTSFSLHVPFPETTSRVEIRRAGVLLWSKSLSAHAPVVNITGPKGGTFSATGTVAVSWTANDLDGDALNFELDYTPDGAKWTPLAAGLTGTSFSWKPGFAQSGSTARLRVIASDGFLTGQADSDPFTLTARSPLAYILAPKNGDTYLEGAVLTMEGGAIASDDLTGATFQWLRGSVPIGAAPTITTTLGSVGQQTFTLRVTAARTVVSAAVTVTVLADYDRDGMPNSWELQNKLDPTDPGDASEDADRDGLSNVREYQLKTNPRLADTDADQSNDGAEIQAGTDPLRADSKPPSAATLYVGSGDLAFTWRQGQFLPKQALFYVRGAGGRGLISWNAASSASWLLVTPKGGTVPTQVQIGVAPQGLAVGEYRGKITFTAEAAGSPHEVQVTLSVASTTSANPAYPYRRVFPKVYLHDSAQATGLAVVNLSASAANLQFKAYSNSGNLLGSAQRTMQPKTQLAQIVDELISTLTGGTGWLQMESSMPDVEGFFLLYDNALTTMDGSPVAGRVYREFVLPVAEGAEVSLVNPDAYAVDYSLFYLSNAGATLGSAQGSIPALGRIVVQSDSLRPQGSSGGYLRGTSGGAVPIEVFGNVNWTAALDATDATAGAGAMTQYVPQFISSPEYQSTLDLINLESAPNVLTLTWLGDTGQIHGQPGTITLPALGATRLVGPAIFGIRGGALTEGYVKIQGSSRFAGAVRFTDPQQITFGSALNLVATGQEDAYFSHVAQNDQYFTGLASINPGTRTAAVTITAYDTAGRQVASGTTQIPPGGRFSKLLYQLVGTLPAMSKGYFQVHSSEPLVSFALFGTWNGSVLSAIPAQHPSGW